MGRSSDATDPSEKIIKSRQRVSDHGEVFTPLWMVEDMLDLVRNESERIDSRFLEPACGSGNFLAELLKRKLNTVEQRYGKSDFEKKRTGEVGNSTPFGNTTARFWPKPLTLGLNGRHQILLLFTLIDQQISKKRGSTLSDVLQA